MEPLTAIAVIVSKYGAAKLIDALSGNQGLGGLTTELVQRLLVSEEQFGQRLNRIESRLDEALGQRYVTALGTGLRTLVDAGTAADARVRNDELLRARDLFREAVASARTLLQVGMAERYLTLCAVGLGRPDAARTALARLERAATEALLESARVGHPGSTQDKASEELEATTTWLGRLRRDSDAWHERMFEIAETKQTAAIQANEFAGRLLVEAGALAAGLAGSPQPRLHRLPPRRSLQTWLSDVGRWQVQPPEQVNGPIRVGTLSVEWHQVRFAIDWNRVHNRQPPDLRPLRIGYREPPPEASVGTAEVDIIVRADPPLPHAAVLRTAVWGEWEQAINEPDEPYEASLRFSTLPRLKAGEPTTRVRTATPICGSGPCTLTVGGALVFLSRERVELKG